MPPGNNGVCKLYREDNPIFERPYPYYYSVKYFSDPIFGVTTGSYFPIVEIH